MPDTFAVSSTRRERSLVDRLRRGARDLGGGEGAAAGDEHDGRRDRDEPDGAVAGDDRDARRRRRRARRGSTASTRSRGPAKRNDDHDVAASDPSFAAATTPTSTIAIASTRWRPYRLGSRKSDVTRKKVVYAFAIWTVGRVEDQPVRRLLDEADDARRAPRARPRRSPRARGIQAGNGARATTATSTANGRRKNCEQVLRRGVRRRPEHARATRTRRAPPSGTAISRGSGRASAARRARAARRAPARPRRRTP